MPKKKKLAWNSEIQTNQILTNDDEVCIPSLSSILLAVLIAVLITWGYCNFFGPDSPSKVSFGFFCTVSIIAVSSSTSKLLLLKTNDGLCKQVLKLKIAKIKEHPTQKGRCKILRLAVMAHTGFFYQKSAILITM